MEMQKQKYLIQIAQDFMMYGIKSMTMDHLSKNLGISKKTLYKHFKDKDDIVCTLIKLDIDEEMNLCDDVYEKSDNAIDETIALSKHLIEKLKMVNPSFLFDLEKYHSEAWDIFITHKRVDIYQKIKRNLDRGVEEGVYRNNLNTEIIAKLYAEKIDTLFNIELFPQNKFSFEKVYSEMMRYHIKGISSETGMKYLKNLKFD